MTRHHRPHLVLAGACLAALLGLLPAVSAQAALGDTVSVALWAPEGIEIDPTPFSLVQAAPLPSGILAAGQGGVGPISEFMLDGEQISFSGHSILIRVAAGSANGLHPGYGAGAQYQLTGITVLGEVITGLSVSGFDGYAGSGSSGLAPGLAAGSLVHAGPGFATIMLDLDNNMTFRDRGLGGSLNYAEIRIDLLSQPVPEPSQWLLMAVGLSALGLLVARRRPGRA